VTNQIQTKTKNGRNARSPLNGKHKCKVGKFSNNPKKDNSSANEWLQKLLNNKQGAGWTDIQTVTHFRNAIRVEILKWYNALPLMDVDNLIWENVKTQFESDFRATPTVSTVIQKLPKIRQKDNKTIIQ
jgi:hypothetical protein